jgi:plastocyanin
MEYFDSGVQSPVTYYAKTFGSSGTFGYEDMLNPTLTGHVQVPIIVTPSLGGTGTPFTVQWATAPVGSDFVWNVGIMRPGATKWVNWQTATSATQATFLPDAGIGTYSFRAQLQQLSTGDKSGFSPAGTITVAVLVLDSGFSPKTATIGQGSIVTWSLPSSDTQFHNVTDSSGMGLFGSGNMPPGSTYAFTFVGAGSYAISDTVSARKSTIAIPPLASPATGGTGTTFNITWASAAPPAGYVFDVQIRRPGAGWGTWMLGQTALSASFTPDAGTGVYSFRARLRNSGNGAASQYSPAASITVS